MNGGSIRHPYAIPARKLFFLVENGPQKQNLERNHGQSLLPGWLSDPLACWALVSGLSRRGLALLVAGVT